MGGGGGANDVRPSPARVLRKVRVACPSRLSESSSESPVRVIASDRVLRKRGVMIARDHGSCSPMMVMFARDHYARALAHYDDARAQAPGASTPAIRPSAADAPRAHSAVRA